MRSQSGAATGSTAALFRIYRVLRDGGRAAISDIVSDEDVPEELQKDPTLWSGCLSGAFREDEFLKAFEAAGFYGFISHAGRRTMADYSGN